MRMILWIMVLLFATAGMAQTTYRWTDPASGRTIISDMPPPTGVKATEKKAGASPAASKDLPYATKQAAEKFPVVLYTQPKCEENCANARTFLKERGIPFSEKNLQSPEEAEAAKKQFGDNFLIPGIMIGREAISGFNATLWNNSLDMAGYPKAAPK